MTYITQNKANEQEPNFKGEGVSQITSWLWIGGEDEVHDIMEQVDVWLDFRHSNQYNRILYVPQKTEYVWMPFQDGDLKALRKVLPQAKKKVEQAHKKGKKVLVSCHAGYSRSATLALWFLCEEMGFEKAWLKMKALRTYFSPDERFAPFIEELRKQYQ